MKLELDITQYVAVHGKPPPRGEIAHWAFTVRGSTELIWASGTLRQAACAAARQAPAGAKTLIVQP